MEPAHKHQSSLDDTTKSGARGSSDEPNKLQGYASAPGVVDDVTRVVDHKAERRLCRRFDIRLLPILAIMCKSSRAIVYPSAWESIQSAQQDSI
jgi:hypothetical protein